MGQSDLTLICVVVGIDEHTGLVQALSPEVSFFNELLGWRLLVRYS